MIRELFVFDLAYRLCQEECRKKNNMRPKEERLKKPVVYSVSVDAMKKAGISMIQNFTQEFVRVEGHELDDGTREYDWPQNPAGMTMSDIRYDGFERETIAALKYFKECKDPVAVSMAQHAVFKERTHPGDVDKIYCPPVAGEDAEDTIDIGFWLAEKIVWYYQQSLNVYRGNFAPRSQVNHTDVLRWLDASFTEAGDVDHAESVDHINAATFEDLLKEVNNVGLSEVDMDRVTTFQDVAENYFSYLRRNPECDELLENACEAVRRSAQAFIKRNRADEQSAARDRGYRVA